MALRQSILLLILTTFSALASAQGLLASGLPSCVQQCTSLIQVATQCGGQTTIGATTWSCFCSTAYPLYQASTGLCGDVCTVATDSQAVMNWYRTNCGSDNGASEHPNGGAAAPSTTAPTTTGHTSTTAVPASTSTTATGSRPANAGVTTDSDANKSWISTHYQWIIFLAVVVVGFAIITVVAVWWKRRYYQKRDQISGGFNTGVSELGPPMSTPAYNNSGNLGEVGSGANSPQRTRDAFMPYGYNHSRSETNLASPSQIPESHRRSPLARGGTPVGDDNRLAAGSDKHGKRTLVRERSAQGPETPPV